MVFWRKKNNVAVQEQDERDDRMLHHPDDPALEPSTESDADIPANVEQAFEETENSILEDLDETPTPEHTFSEDAREAEELSDHTREGGWLSRLTKGLSKSSNKITKGLADLVTKKKLDQEALDRLEEILIEADLGPATSAKIIERFSKERLDKEISEEEIREALAVEMEGILTSVAKPLEIKKPENGPYVILVAGVNGVGKTTTIGKLASHLTKNEGHSVMMAAGDTFRAAAVEQLEEWSKRVGCAFLSKDVGADSAAVAYEAYEHAKAQNVDILLIDTAGRLQNKANLMAELEKIVRVLKKQDEALPHATLLVLDSTTGQNAFSQLETYKELIDVTGLIVTKLDGSAKGGVLVGLADRFGTPVHAIGIGEGIEDMQSFKPCEYSRSLMGL